MKPYKECNKEVYNFQRHTVSEMRKLQEMSCMYHLVKEVLFTIIWTFINCHRTSLVLQLQTHSVRALLNLLYKHWSVDRDPECSELHWSTSHLRWWNWVLFPKLHSAYLWLLGFPGNSFEDIFLPQISVSQSPSSVILHVTLGSLRNMNMNIG